MPDTTTGKPSEFIQVSETAGGIAAITLNRPDRKNALSIALRDEVTAALGRLKDDKSLKAVILTGAGDVFSAGFDLSEFQKIGDPVFRQTLWESADRFHRALLGFPVPIVAAVNGPALAGGFDVAVLCDIRLGSTKAVFGHVEYTFGDVVYGPLREIVGGAMARDLCLTGRKIDAAEAHRIGLLSAVVEPDKLAGEARRYAELITKAPRDCLLRTKAKFAREMRFEFTTTLEM